WEGHRDGRGAARPGRCPGEAPSAPRRPARPAARWSGPAPGRWWCCTSYRCGLVPIVLAGLLVTGLAVPGWPGALALILVAAFLGGLAPPSRPRLGPVARGPRVCARA